MVTPMRRPARLQHRADNPPAHAARPSPGCSHVGRPRPNMCANGDKRLLQACEQVPVRARSAFSGQLHGRYGLGVAARATPTPDTCRRSCGGSRARRGAAELSLIYADRRRVVQAVPASPGVRSPLEQFLERLLVLAQLLGCLPAYDEREERLSDSRRLEVEGELAMPPSEGQRLLDHSHSGANHPGGSAGTAPASSRSTTSGSSIAASAFV
jgi:hypothetical protein